MTGPPASAPGSGWTERDRLAALASYDVLDSAPEPAFDDIADLAANILQAPIALVSLVAGDRQFFKADRGFGAPGTPLDSSICATVLLNPGVTVIPDLAADPRFTANPLVQDPVGPRFYAGAPITSPDGLPLGMLCVLDTEPRPAGITTAQTTALAALARQVMSLLELRRSVADSRAAQAAHRESEAAQHESEARLAAMFAQATVGLCELGPTGRFIRVNDEYCRLLGRTEAELFAADVFALTHIDDLQISRRAMAKVLASGRPSRLIKRYRRPDNEVVWAEIGLTRLDGEDGVPRSVLTVATDLSDRMAASERLSLSEETLRLSTDAAEVGTWDLNLLADELTWSGRTKAMFGVAPDATVSMADFYAILHPDDLGPTAAAFLAAVDPAIRSTYDVEYRTIGRIDGVIRWVAAKGRALFDPEGRCTRAIGTAIDITTRKHDEDRLRRSEAMLIESEAKFRAITDSIDQMVWSNRPDGTDDFYNRRWYEYTGLPERSLAGPAWAGLYHPDDQAPARQAWRHSLETGDPYRIEYRLRHRSGHYRWVLARAQPVRDGAARITRWYGTCTDIQEIVEARDLLARSRRELELEVERRTIERDQVWRNAQDLLLVVDGDGLFRAANPAWERTLGWHPDEIIGRNVLEFVHPDDIEATRAAVPEAIAGRIDTFENRYPHHVTGDLRTISWVLALENGLIYASGRDVTAERAAAAALATTQEQLRQAQKMEAVGQLTGGIAHDFNNMLTVVIGSLDLLGRRLAPDAARERRYVESALDGARRAALLTQRLLAFARQQPLQPVPIDLNSLIAGMSELLRHSLGIDIRLQANLADGLWQIDADPNQLENVILNLAVNGRDAMAKIAAPNPDGPDGSDGSDGSKSSDGSGAPADTGAPAGNCLTITTANVHLDHRWAETHPGTPPGDYVLLTVGDTGRGMTDAVAARAFDPFFTTKDVGRGTGLGLSQVYGFVKQSGGHVQLASEVGRGTTVTITLPRLAARPPERAPEATPRDTPPGPNAETVLVVEDDAAVRRFSVDALTTLGYRVLEADGAATGMQALATTPDVALLFTDLLMPDTNGRQLADEARRRRPGLKILFTTGYNPGEAPAPGTPPGPTKTNVLAKPFTVAELATKIRTVLDA